MAAPEGRTREGIAERARWSGELAALRIVWRAACQQARRHFIDEIFEALCDHAR